MDKLNDISGVSADLVKKYFDGNLSGTERHEFARWLWNDRKNRELLEHLRAGKNLKPYFDQWQQIEPEREYELLAARCPELAIPKVRKTYYWRWVAAVCILLLGGSLSLLVFRPSSHPLLEDAVEQDANVLAILKTSDGREFRLGGQNSPFAGGSPQGLQVFDSLKELVCEDLATQDSQSFHQLYIPKGGEYRLVLPDGTKVWLNSESMIRFPGTFSKNERKITVSGEVYLEVVRDERRPFRIAAGEGSVEVLGTSFGISVYPEDKVWSTTLVKGSVRVSYGKQATTLVPGKKAYVTDEKLHEMVVDTDKELAWVNGIFLFEHNRLEDVVKKLSRWYNVEFRFANDGLKENQFTGEVSRDTGLDGILDLIGRMNVIAFEKKDGYILIKEKTGI